MTSGVKHVGISMKLTPEVWEAICSVESLSLTKEQKKRLDEIKHLPINERIEKIKEHYKSK